MPIERLRLASHDPSALVAFYGAAFGARAIDLGVALGDELVEIGEASAPDNSTFLANETGFQHFALVVSDIAAAYAHLSGVAGWRPISLDGPMRLPQASGGASAFKFRDPCGHPLELLQFPSEAMPAAWRARLQAEPHRLFHGIDHTGLTVSDAEASRAFYESLGFVCEGCHINAGEEQRRLDRFAETPELKILSMSPPDGSRPGVELLAYRAPAVIVRSASDGSAAATQIVLSSGAPSAATDPDGHRIVSPSQREFR